MPQRNWEFWSVFVALDVPYVAMNHSQPISWNRHYELERRNQ